MSGSPTPPDLSVIIPILSHSDSLANLVSSLTVELTELAVSYEILLVGSPAFTAGGLSSADIKSINPKDGGYASALRAGFAAAMGSFLLTIDSDLASSVDFIRLLWEKRHAADVTIASRYVPGAKVRMPAVRYALSYAVNLIFSRGLSLHVRDMSSGIRLYTAAVLRRFEFVSTDLGILQEILTKFYCEGYRIGEVPFEYEPNSRHGSYTRMVSFGRAYLRTFATLYRLRNSILSADYDDRAYDSIIYPQRYWQRQRFQHIVGLTTGQGPTLDVGCGSSRIIQALPTGSIVLDILVRKLRYVHHKFDKPVLLGSGFDIPFGDGSFPCVLCSQVIEHVPKTSPILDELCRVLAPGGRLVLGTPDYANWEWRVTEAIYGKVLPSAYADEHISHYTKQELIDLFAARGYKLLFVRYILRGELILTFQKPR